VRKYYDRRAPEYDDWYRGEGQYAERDRPGWHAELEALIAALRALPPARTLDVACGTGYLSRHLPGDVCGLDQSAEMLAVAAARVDSTCRADALARLPFDDGAFERVATGHFYGHLRPGERAAFLAEARRVGRELLVIDSARRPDVPAERMDPRTLSDGSEHSVFKRWLTPGQLREELGGGRVVHAGRWFVGVVSVS
jgi:SAM-dependent methyltransferase